MSSEAPQPGPISGASPPPGNGFGIASLALGIAQFPVSLFCVLGVVVGALAIVFGWLGMARASKGEATNRGMAKAGFILGIVGVLLSVVFVVILVIVGANKN